MVEPTAKRGTQNMELIDQICENLRVARDILNGSYLGMATDINTESVEHYLKHLEFLKLCCQSTREYVKYKKEIFIALNNTPSDMLLRYDYLQHYTILESM
jgi:hypothetical protein